MPTFNTYTQQQAGQALAAIGAAVYTPIAPLRIQTWWSREPLPFAARTQGVPRSLNVGDTWGDLFDCAWFHFTGAIPEQAAGQPVVLLLDVNGELCVVDENGVPRRGLTNVSSGFDYSLGSPGKRVLPITPSARGGEAISVWADAGCNDLFGELREKGAIKEACIATCNEALRALYFDCGVSMSRKYPLLVGVVANNLSVKRWAGSDGLFHEAVEQQAT